MNEKCRDVLLRAVKTFWQAALAYLLTDAALLKEALTAPGDGKCMLFSLLIGAIAAGFSAIYNGLVRPALGNGHGE